MGKNVITSEEVKCNKFSRDQQYNNLSREHTGAHSFMLSLQLGFNVGNNFGREHNVIAVSDTILSFQPGHIVPSAQCNHISIIQTLLISYILIGCLEDFIF